MACLKVLPQYLPGDTEVKHENVSKVGIQRIFDLRIFRLQAQSGTDAATNHFAIFNETGGQSLCAVISVRLANFVFVCIHLCNEFS
jgi:hypothetical protein